MKTKLTILALFSTLALAQADVMIYRITESARLIGSGGETRVNATGYYVQDVDTGETVVIAAMKLNGSKVFTVTRPGGVLSYVANGARGQTYTVMSRYEEKTSPFQEISGIEYGVDQVLAIRPDRQIIAPKIRKGTAQSITAAVANDAVVYVGTTTAGFIQKDTQDANFFARTVEDLLQQYRGAFQARGYFEIQR